MKQNDLAVKMILAAWMSGHEKINKALSVLPDETMDATYAPGRNKISWIIGHLAAVNDSLFSILELGKKLNENYYNYFTKNNSGIIPPGIAEIRQYWQETATLLNKKIAELSTDDWFKKHSLVSSEDFEKEPHRNKLNVLLSRTTHLNHHYGQLAPLLIKR